ncbi:MAG TPA: hypothetical protein VHB02_02350 [Acidimicrobiales bacterium]|nr:hypothetical protein [Acidimicrobiales bacterium]
MTSTGTATTTYHASFTLDPSGQWLVEVDELPQVHSFGRTLGKAREYLLDALALWLDEPVAKVKAKVAFRSPTLPDDVQHTVAMALAEREIAEAAGRVAAELTQQASTELVNDARLSMRDAADILGLSHQRVQQLVSGTEPSSPQLPDPIADALDSFAKAFREYLPGGSKEDLGMLAAVLAVSLAAIWVESKS